LSSKEIIKIISFLYEESTGEKQEKLLAEKVKKLSQTKIGKELGVKETSSIQELPLTSYPFYKKFFENPSEDAFLYPLNQYIQVITSGTVGKSKPYLVYRGFYGDQAMVETLVSTMILSTHDGEKINFRPGDVCYVNVAPAPYGAGVGLELLKRLGGSLFKMVPEDFNLPFHAKVEYFIKNYEKIDLAYMPVATLLDTIYPRIGKPFKLKGYVSQDRAADPLKNKIKEITGVFPTSLYASTETGLAAVPSVEYPTGFIFSWKIMYVEFIPEENALTEEFEKVENVETVSLQKVEPGKRYQPVVTPFKWDLTRYVMPDLLECVSKNDKILNVSLPVFKFYARADKIISLQNFTRISENELLTALEKAKVPFIDFTVRVEIHGTKEYLVMYIEPSQSVDIDEIQKNIHKELYETDNDYRSLTDFLKYVPLKVQLLPQGAFKRYLERRGGIPKIERIGMREDRFKELLQS